MFGRLSGKRHFRAHSCHSLGTWILPQRVQWWGAGRGRYAFYLRMASCERTWCETKTGCSDIQSLTHSPLPNQTRSLSFFPPPPPPLSPKLFPFFCPTSFSYISSSFTLFKSSVPFCVGPKNLNKQSSLCGESFPSPLPKGMLLPILRLTMVTWESAGNRVLHRGECGHSLQRGFKDWSVCMF